MSTKILPLHSKLTAAWSKKPPNLPECGQLLDTLKVKLTSNPMDFLPTQNPERKDGPSSEKNKDIIRDINIARNILEIGAQYSVEMQDIAAFERYMAQLKCYYLDYKPAGLDESAYKHELLGLNLLRLLAQNKLSDFHTELELLPTEDMQKNIYIKHPVQIEQYLMEGSYNKVFLARDNIPAPSYKFFMDMLLKTIRNEIASCIEKAYEKVSFVESMRMLFCESADAMNAYTTERNWTLNTNDNVFYFHREKKADDFIPAIDLAQQAIDYARELEMIV